MTTYKSLKGTAGSYGYGDYADYLPTKNEDGTYTPGDWLPPVKPELCSSGYHTCAGVEQLVHHLGESIYEVETRGECVAGEDKQAHESIRLVKPVETWNERTARLFAVDCARRVAHLTVHPELTHACLDICVAYAEFGDEWIAARAAAGSAAWAAAWIAAQEAAGSAAWAAARIAAGSAAWAAARDAARAAARAAARDAARDAAWVAAEVAARAAARVAAEVAAWEAASDILARYLDGEEGPFVEESK